MVRFPMRKSQLKSIPYRLYVTKSRPSPFFILTNYISLMYMNSANSRRISEEIHICSKFAKQIVNSQCCDKKLQPNETARNSLHIVLCLGKVGSSLCYQSKIIQISKKQNAYSGNRTHNVHVEGLDGLYCPIKPLGIKMTENVIYLTIYDKLMLSRKLNRSKLIKWSK